MYLRRKLPQLLAEASNRSLHNERLELPVDGVPNQRNKIIQAADKGAADFSAVGLPAEQLGGCTCSYLRFPKQSFALCFYFSGRSPGQAAHDSLTYLMAVIKVVIFSCETNLEQNIVCLPQESETNPEHDTSFSLQHYYNQQSVDIMTKDTFSTRLHPLSALRATSFEMLCKRMNDRLIAKLTIFPVIKRSKLNDKKKINNLPTSNE